jgi:Holliday junction resolvase RusA-like endonuclease
MKNSNLIILKILPPSLNNLYEIKNGKQYKTTKYKNFLGYIECYFIKHKATKVIGPVKLIIKFYFIDDYDMDLDNMLKAIIDATKNTLYEDDSKIVQIQASKYLNHYETCTTIEIIPHAPVTSHILTHSEIKPHC